MSRWKAVIFDLGGVVLDSPLEEIARFEVQAGVTPGTINRVVSESGSAGAWACHERGELDRSEFLQCFADELAEAGERVDTDALMQRIDASIRPRSSMIRALLRLRESGLLLGAITNNWTLFGDDPLVSRFDVFVESVSEGVRKPESEIYRRCVERLGVDADRCIMLDDLGPNLKPARAMGMHTIKVSSAAQALYELGTLVGLDLS